MSMFNYYCLGCGSAKPSPVHNPSCSVLDIRGTLYMIDCGEGAQRAMQSMHLKFNRLRHIFITHLHGDHILGLPGLLSTLSLSGCTGTITVHTFEKGVKLLRNIMDNLCTYPTFDLEFDTIEPAKGVVLDNGILTVRTVPLEHRIPTVGYIFEEKPKLRHIKREMCDFHHVPFSQMNKIKEGADFVKEDGTVVPNHLLTTDADHAVKYSHISDTMFMPSLVPEIEASDLLLHESTYLNDLADTAAERGHSTAAQAAETARMANVRELLLTHYSSRYRDETVLLNEAKTIFPHTILNREGLKIEVDKIK